MQTAFDMPHRTVYAIAEVHMSKMLFALIALAAVPAGAGLLWGVDFTCPPAGWMIDPEWTFNLSGAHLDITSTSYSGQGVNIDVFMNSDRMIIPTEVDSIWIVLTHTHSMSGWAASGESSSDMYAILEINGVEHILDEAHANWGFKGLARDDRIETSGGFFAVNQGDTLQFFFTGSTYAVAGASARLIWNINSLTISTDPAVSFDRTSWAEIKSLFTGP